jgi:hypothetical protein
LSRVVWGALPHLYEDGVDRGVLYLDGAGVAWNGLVSVDEKEVGTVDTSLYFDGLRYQIGQEAGDFAASVTAFTYPEEFLAYDGYSEGSAHKTFGFSYRTSDAKLHVVYNAVVRPTQQVHNTSSGSAEVSNFIWDLSTLPADVDDLRPTSHLVLDTKRFPQVTAMLEDILYGTETTEPRLPDPAEILSLYEGLLILEIIYNGDGSWTAIGPDSMVQPYPDGSFDLSSPSLDRLRDGMFVVDSY